MFKCPNCKTDCKRLIANTFITNSGELKCENCYESKSERTLGLQDTLCQQNGIKISKGKAWEIRNRTKSKDDGRTVINKITGKPTQF